MHGFGGIMFRLKLVCILVLALLLTSCGLLGTSSTAAPTTVAIPPTVEQTPEPVPTEMTAEVTATDTVPAPVPTEATVEVTATDTVPAPVPTSSVPAPVPTATTPAPVVSDNCAISLNGQSYYISGGGGGLTTDPSKIEPRWMQADWGQITNLVTNYTSAITPSQKVAILIADDFRGRAPEEVLGNNPNEGSLTAAGIAPRNRISHGQLVYEHIYNLLRRMGYQLQTETGAPQLSSEWMTSNSTLLRVMQIDSAGLPDGPAYKTNLIEAHVETAIKALRTQDFSRFVVNMSFSILPCDTVDEFEQDFVRAGKTFDDYKEFLKKDRGITDFGNWLNDQVKRVLDIGPDDALAAFIAGSNDIVFISSAGNFGDIIDKAQPPIRNFRFYPGAWEGVINVSGLEGDPQSLIWWPFSNLGEIKLPAAWFQYLDQNGTPTPTAYYYAGTSFAAPIMSVIAALYETNCPFDNTPPTFADSIYPDPTSIPIFSTLSARPPC